MISIYLQPSNVHVRVHLLFPPPLISTVSHTEGRLGTAEFVLLLFAFIFALVALQNAFLFGRASHIQVLSRIQEGGD